MYKGFQVTKILCLIAVLFMVTACLDLEPDSAVNFLGTDHTLTATFVDPDENGEPISDAFLVFTVISGPNEGLTSQPFNGECVPDNCITNELGQVSWTYSGNIVGIDTIIARAANPDNPDEFGPTSDAVTKIWQRGPAPIPTLSQWGLIAMAGILGIVGFIVIRRRNLTA